MCTSSTQATAITCSTAGIPEWELQSGFQCSFRSAITSHSGTERLATSTGSSIAFLLPQRYEGLEQFQ
jgi:hypothetical protein